MVREKSVKSQGISFQTKSGHPDAMCTAVKPLHLVTLSSISSEFALFAVIKNTVNNNLATATNNPLIFIIDFFNIIAHNEV